jgi:hypothetical protein
MRTLTVSTALLCILVLAPATGAQSEMPTELWSEYPLVQKVERTETGTALGPVLGPFLPPNPEESAAPAESTRWSLWLALLGLAAVTIVFGVRAASPALASGARVVGGGLRRVTARARRARPRPRAPRTDRPKPVQLREPPLRPRPPVRRRQYAPLPPVSVPEEDVEREPRRFVVRRSGLFRSRFVVVADEPGGSVKRVGSSKSFWSVGRRERGADEAWSNLVDELRDAGWQPYSPRSEYYTLLRRVDDETSSLPPLIEAYTLTAHDRSGRA